MHLSDEVDRSAFRLVINSANVFAKEPKRNQLQATEKENGDQKRCVAGNVYPQGNGSNDNICCIER